MESYWLPSKRVPPLENGSVQVWRLLLDESLLKALEPLLSEDECARAARIRAGNPRAEFIAARGALRLLLGAVLGQDPQQLDFILGEQGKPSPLGGGLDFNVSHSGGCILIALSRAGEVGVDVEPTSRTAMGVEEAMELARTNFHPDEVAHIAAEPGESEQLAAFFRCWTRKEAVVKADGRGMQIRLSAFCVMVRNPVHLPAGEALWVHDLPLQQGFSGALALPQREFQPTFLDFTAALCDATQAELTKERT